MTINKTTMTLTGNLADVPVVTAGFGVDGVALQRVRCYCRHRRLRLRRQDRSRHVHLRHAVCHLGRPQVQRVGHRGHPVDRSASAGTAGIAPAVPAPADTRRHDQTSPSAFMAAQRHARGAGGRGLAGSRPDPDRRGDELRHHQRHQHGAALSQRRPRGGPTRRALQGGRHRRLPQHDAAHGRPAPHHRRQGRSLRLQGRQQRLRRSHAARRAPTWSAGCRCASRTAAASSPGCTPPSWPRC